MDCTKYRKLISQYIDEETSGVQRDALEKHMDGCAHCKTYMQSQLHLRDMLKASYPETVEIDVSASIMSRIKPAQTIRKSGGTGRLTLFIAAAAAVCVFAIAALMTLHQDNNTFAGNEKLEEYVIQHVDSGSADFNGRLANVNVEK
jgi:anti-sigma factor RsiW